MGARQGKHVEERNRSDTGASVLKFEELRHRMDRLQSEADLASRGSRVRIGEGFDGLVAAVEAEAIEAELRHLKTFHGDGRENDPPA